MPKVELHSETEPVPEDSSKVSPATGSLLMSLAFWSTLVLSAIMYAAVSLSPKLADWMHARQQLTSNALRLQQLENEADYLDRIAVTLKKDPEFAQRLVRLSQSPEADPAMLDSEHFANSDVQASTPDKKTAATAGWLMKPQVHNAVMRMASDQKLRGRLLMAAAGCTLFAFTLLNNSGARFAVQFLTAIGTAFRLLFRRYQKPVVIEDAPNAESIG